MNIYYEYIRDDLWRLTSEERLLLHQFLTSMIIHKVFFLHNKHIIINKIINDNKNSLFLINFFKKLFFIISLKIKKNDYIKIYNYIKKSILFLLQNNSYSYAFLETSHTISHDMISKTETIIRYYENIIENPIFIFSRINKNIIGGFQIYCSKKKITLTYQRILYDIEKNKNPLFLLNNNNKE